MPRGLTDTPDLAVGDGALGFWKALDELFPRTRHQRCWMHKTANVLNKLPKSLRKSTKTDIHDIWMAQSRVDATAALQRFAAKYEKKYPAAVACLTKDQDDLLAFYDLPAEHWVHLRTTNPIESVFATVRHRTIRAKGCLSHATAVAMVFMLITAATRPAPPGPPFARLSTSPMRNRTHYPSCDGASPPRRHEARLHSGDGFFRSWRCAGR